MSVLRFQYKLWNLINSNTTGSVQWNKTGDAVIFNFTLFKKEYLDYNSDFCKSNKLASFIRQLNLYGFNKVSDLRRMRKRDCHVFKNCYFLQGREDLLQYVERNSISSKIKKRIFGKRKNVRGKKNCYAGNQAQKRQRGRPKKIYQYNINHLKGKENDHSYEKKKPYMPTKNFSVLPNPKIAMHFKNVKTKSSIQVSGVKSFNKENYGGGKSFFKLKISCKPPMKMKKEFSQVEKVMQNNELLTKRYIALNKAKMQKSVKHTLKTEKKEDVKLVLQNKVNVTSTSIETPNKIAVSVLQNGKKPHVPPYMIANSTTNSLSYPTSHPKWEMQAVVDENQHVLLKIKEPSPINYKSDILPVKCNQGNSLVQKISNEKNACNREQILSIEKEMHNIATNCLLCNHSMKNDEKEIYKSKYVYETDCEITEEYLEIKKAYFRQYEELPKYYTWDQHFKNYEQFFLSLNLTP
ncbi:heat shock factor protein 2 [Nephila pilipes]|uniref:Heat shock factor protein 2 n=1 Tax=Nephila pilipes TaxID=299642 RepID=A0A8X6NRX9_NEPPI|nr:heat shock factor protein 2 [Nephila pilipes]